MAGEEHDGVTGDSTGEQLVALAMQLEQTRSQLDEMTLLKSALAEQVHVQAELFERLVRQDALTGLLARRAFDHRLAEEFARANRYLHPLSVVMIDIDHFRAINDRYSHDVGDRVLQVVADLCLANFRNCDAVARYGGEEFAIILPETMEQDAIEVCERLRISIELFDWRSIAPDLHVTISAGISGWVDAPNQEKMLANADFYLSYAKHDGRNLIRSLVTFQRDGIHPIPTASVD